MKKKLLLILSFLLLGLAAHAIKTSDLNFLSADTLPLVNTLAPDATVKYSRLPDALADTVRTELRDLGYNSAGIAVRFRTDASAIGARWKSRNKFNMNHMTPTGIRGLDLYVLDSLGQWTTVSSARPVLGNHTTTTMVITDMTPAQREYMLYLSLYDGVDSLYIGIDSTATLQQPMVDSPVASRPIIMYGTSILQGGCATRPGMCHTNILQRMLNRQVMNLGFSGNAKLDPGIALLIAQVPNPGVIVLEPLPNLKTPELQQRFQQFYQIIRKAHPSTPILLVESPIFPLMRFNNETRQTITEKNNAFKEIYNNLKPGDKNLHYYLAENILGDCWEGTVDNYHFTDMGFQEYANHLAPVIQNLLDSPKN